MKLLSVITAVCLVPGLLSAAEESSGWITLFDGKSLDGWKINENPESWKLEDGVLTCNGKRSHIFYVGDAAPFRDFELQLMVLTQPNSNSGVYFHTKYQETDWPKAGFECQVNNTYTTDPRKTGSLYAVKDVHEAPAVDNEWWKYTIRVEGNTVTISVNDKVVNTYVEPADAKPGKDFERKLGEGTFALQAHDPGSTVSFKDIRVKKLGSSDKGTAAKKAAGVDVGDAAPSFTLLDEEGKEWNSDEHFKEGKTVVYFYPADFTGGCTKQACSYRDDFGKLKERGVTVVGISGDSPQTHALFKKAHDLNFTLLSDPEGKVAAMFGVPFQLGERSVTVDGQQLVRTATIQRWTFVVEDGKVASKNSKVNAAGDSAAILEQVGQE